MRVLRAMSAGDVLLAGLVLAGVVLVALLNSRAPEASTDTFAATDYRSGGYAAWYALLQREDIVVERFDRRPAELDSTVDTLIAARPVVPVGEDVRRAPDRAALARWVYGGGRLITLGDANPFAANGPRLTALRTPYGRGAIVSAGDPHLFDNASIARADNARLAFALAKPRRPGGIVAFDEALHGTIVDRRWWQAIDIPQRVALTGIALAVLIALAGSALRLGPAVTLRVAREPASDEFIAAVGALYERSHARHAAIALLAAGARDLGGEAMSRLRLLAENPAPTDRDLIAAAKLARAIRQTS